MIYKNERVSLSKGARFILDRIQELPLLIKNNEKLIEFIKISW